MATGKTEVKNCAATVIARSKIWMRTSSDAARSPMRPGQRASSQRTDGWSRTGSLASRSSLGGARPPAVGAGSTASAAGRVNGVLHPLVLDQRTYGGHVVALAAAVHAAPRRRRSSEAYVPRGLSLIAAALS